MKASLDNFELSDILIDVSYIDTPSNVLAPPTYEETIDDLAQLVRYDETVQMYAEMSTYWRVMNIRKARKRKQQAKTHRKYLDKKDAQWYK